MKRFKSIKQKNDLQVWQRPANEWKQVCQNFIELDEFIDLYKIKST